MNLFIIEEDPLTIVNLRVYLKIRFGTEYKVHSFLNSNEAIRQVDADTKVVILDYDQGEVNGYEVYKSIKKLNADTKVILRSTCEEIGDAIEMYANEKSTGSLGKKKPKVIQTTSVFKFATYPVDVIVNEFGVNKSIVTYILSFIVIGIVLFVSFLFIM